MIPILADDTPQYAPTFLLMFMHPERHLPLRNSKSDILPLQVPPHVIHGPVSFPHSILNKSTAFLAFCFPKNSLNFSTSSLDSTILSVPDCRAVPDKTSSPNTVVYSIGP